MTSFIDKHISPNEKLILEGSVALSSFIKDIVIIIACVLIAFLLKEYTKENVYGLFFLGIALYEMIKIFLLFLTSVMLITDQKVLAKYGIFHVELVSVSLDRIEMLHIKQSFFARIMGYGTVIITGTGSNPVVFKNVSNPHAMKMATESARNGDYGLDDNQYSNVPDNSMVILDKNGNIAEVIAPKLRNNIQRISK